jgi:hypothetical protein
MNFWSFAISLSIFVYSLIFDRTLLAIYGCLFAAYLAMNLIMQGKTPNTVDRKIQISTWNSSGDPSVFGRQEIDVTNLDGFIAKFNKAHPSEPMSYMIIFAKALGSSLVNSKKLNGKIVFGQFLLKANNNITVLVHENGQYYGSLLLENCNQLGLRELNQQYLRKAEKVKQSYQDSLTRKPRWVDYIPSVFVQSIMRLSSWISYDLELNVPILNMRPDHYGYGILTDLSSYGVSDCTAPLVPFMKSIFSALLNAPVKRPMYMNGELTIRSILYFNLTFDHRFGDGSDAMKLMSEIHTILENPEGYL